jgi:MoxR-like ATPase
MPSVEREDYVVNTIEVNTPAPMPSISLALLPPDPKWGKQYINRRIDGVMDFDILDYARNNNVNVRIEGEAGSGKTMCVQGYASARNLPYFNVSNNTSTEPSELFGQWIPTPDGKYRWQDGAVTQLVRHGGVLLLNEVNFLPARVSTVLFSLLDYRREIQLMSNGGEVIKAHPNLLIVADMNLGYKGTQELNQAFSDRFGIKLEFHYDKSIESKIVKSKALLELASQLREQYENEVVVTPTSTRALVDFVNNTKNFGINFAITSFVNGYNKDERHAVRVAVETHKDNISMDLGLSTAPSHPASRDEDNYVTMNIKGNN